MVRLGAVVLLLTMVSLPAFAYSQEDADACTPDAMRLCQNAIPDVTRVTQCLVQNRQRLSPACSSVFNRPNGASAEGERPAKTHKATY